MATEQETTAPKMTLKSRSSGLFNDRTTLVTGKSASIPGIPISSFPPEVQGTMQLFDHDGDMTVSPGELVAAARLLDKAKQRNTMLMRMLGGVVVFCVLLVCSDLGTSIAAAKLASDMRVSGSVLTVKGTNAPVQVAQSFTPTKLSSYLGDAMFRELRYFNATSPTGAVVHVQVDGFLRMPTQPCHAPVVQLHTPVGSIYLEGSTLEFEETATSPFFLQAGFLTTPSGPGRRRLSSSSLSLVGFFNMLHSLEAHASTANCTPALPTQPRRFRALSSRASMCGPKCVERPYGFPLSGLVGTTMIQGQVGARPLRALGGMRGGAERRPRPCEYVAPRAHTVGARLLAVRSHTSRRSTLCWQRLLPSMAKSSLARRTSSGSRAFPSCTTCA